MIPEQEDHIAGIMQDNSILNRWVKMLFTVLLLSAVKPVLRYIPNVKLQRIWTLLMSGLADIPKQVSIHQCQYDSVPTEVITSNQYKENSGPTILYFHGGAYCIGSARTHRGLTSHLAEKSGGRIIVPDYRLAPEFPFPSALEDGLSVYQQILEEGVAPELIVIAGDSAGGGLALALALKIKEKQMPKPVALLLYSPWTDLSVLPEDTTLEKMLSNRWLIQCRDSYCQNTPATHHCISPYLSDLSGLPPMLVQAGTDEMLLPSVRAFCTKSEQSGISLRYSVFQGMWHVFQLHAGFITESDKAILESATFINHHIVRENHNLNC